MVRKLYKLKSFSPEATYEIAFQLAQKLKGSELIALEGDLGAGKTQFVKGLAAGLGASDPVTSPTFMLLHNYEGRLPLAHFDVYRLPTPQALEELGYEEFFYGPGVTAVEWSDLISEYLPEDYLLVRITRIEDAQQGEGRLIELVPSGQTSEALVDELQKEELFKNDSAGD